MSAFYEKLQSTASDLLTRYGQQLTFTRTTTGAYDPNTGSASESTTTYKGYGAAFDYSTHEVDGSIILNDDIKLLLENTKQIPQVNDKVTVNSKEYLILAVSETNPGGTAVMTTCQLRIGDRGSVIR